MTTYLFTGFVELQSSIFANTHRVEFMTSVEDDDNNDRNWNAAIRTLIQTLSTANARVLLDIDWWLNEDNRECAEELVEAAHKHGYQVYSLGRDNSLGRVSVH